MKTTMLMLILVSGALADEHKHPAPPPNPILDKLKTLQGAWEGTTKEDGKDMKATVSFKTVSGGSVVMSTLGEGSPYEMVTMFHLNQKDVMATHYCAANNQPRFKAVAAGPNQVAFEFKDGTNIGPNDGYMQKIVFIFDGPDHHMEDWTYRSKGKDSTSRFDFKRKK